MDDRSARHRIVVLCGPRLTHRNTCATLIGRGLNVVGICEADQRRGGVPVAAVRRAVKKHGVLPTLAQAAARVLHCILRGRRDRVAFESIFNRAWITETLESWDGDIHRTDRYSAPSTLDWLAGKKPDIIVIHTPYWVGKKVRDLPASGMVLGGHPGITPDYRGTHSAFWALYKGKPEDVGCTVFIVDKGVDTGDVVAQERLPIDPDDSFMTLAWKGMKRIAEMQADVLEAHDRGRPIPRRPVTPPPGSQYDHPTLRQYLSYRRQLPRHVNVDFSD